MFKKRKIPVLPLLMFAIVVGGIFVLWQNAVETKNIEADIKNYQIARNCQDVENCREILEATIIDSHKVKTEYTVHLHKYLTRRYVHIDYYSARLQLSNYSIYETAILPALDIEDRFDLANVYFPVPFNEFDYAGDIGLPSGVTVNVEFWHGKPTVIFTKYIYSYNAQEEIEYALPTIDNPIVQHFILQENLNQSLSFLFTTGLLLFVMLFIRTIK